MKYNLIVRLQAELDITDSAFWYERRSKGLGGDFLSKIDAALVGIATNPFMYPVINKNVRRVLVTRFPYCIYYVIHQ